MHEFLFSLRNAFETLGVAGLFDWISAHIAIGIVAFGGLIWILRKSRQGA